MQDVRRLPDEPFYHEEGTQKAILDVLFIYCKANPTSGGYRQGMHELLAPIFYVMDQDAIEPVNIADPTVDAAMAEMLDGSFVEHDAFALFDKVMEKARDFYEVADMPASLMAADQSQSSRIVDRSKYIHETLLFKADPELSAHLKAIDILPQIFLMLVHCLSAIKSILRIADVPYPAVGYDCYLEGSFHLLSCWRFGILFLRVIHRWTSSTTSVLPCS